MSVHRLGELGGERRGARPGGRLLLGDQLRFQLGGPLGLGLRQGCGRRPGGGSRPGSIRQTADGGWVAAGWWDGR